MKPRRIGIGLELMWPYRRHMDVFAGTQRFAREAGWNCELDDFIHEATNARAAVAGYDGLIARANTPLARLARQTKVPLVNVWFGSPETEQLVGVFPDFMEMGRQACEHLTARGFRQFGCLSNPRDAAHQILIAGFHAVVEEFGCRCRCAKSARLFYRNGQSWMKFQRMLDRWISTWTPPVALFVAINDVTTRYVVHACHRHGLRVPEDVALITPTNEPLICDLPPPSLTSVDVSFEQIGYLAAQLLDQLMRGNRPPSQHTLVHPAGIVARDSTDFFAVDDQVVALAMRFIEQHTHEPISVNDVVAATGVSRRTLERRFHDCAGRSIAAEIRRLRLLKAKRLLAETDLLVKQIASETGFRDPIRLHEVFVRVENMTPTEYRQTVQGRRPLQQSRYAEL